MAKIVNVNRLAITATAARVALVVGLKYALKPTADCWIRQGGSTVDAVADAANNWPLAANETIELTPTDPSNAFVSVIGTSGALFIAIEEGG